MIHGMPEKLANLRMKQGFSQREVAKRLDISPSIVSGYETGERTPSVEVLLSLSRLYKCSTDYLLGKDQDRPAKVLDVSELSEEQVHVLRLLIETMKT